MSSGSNGSNIYQYGQSPAADTGAITGAQGLANASSGAQNLYNAASQGLSGLTAPTSYTPQQGVNAGNAITSAAQGLNLPQAAANALQMGSNANAGLYQQELQQTNDQTNAALAQRGIATTPYGAGVQALADQTFNNNWNTNQAALQNTAANTAANLLGAYNNSLAQGQGVAQGAANNSLNALQSLLASGNLSTGQLQQAITDYLAYLQGGTSASSAQAQAQNQNAKMQNAGLGGLGNLVGNVVGMLPIP